MEQITPSTILKQDQLLCSVHQSEYCLQCDLDYSDVNLISKAFKLNNGYLPPLNPKLNQEIDRFKKAGNQHHKQKLYDMAVESYTKGIHLSIKRPVWDDVKYVTEEITILLSNRAASYIELEAYELALFDADMVIKIRPDWQKGFFRKGKALLGLAQYGLAVEAFEMALILDKNSKDIQASLEEAKRFAP